MTRNQPTSVPISRRLITSWGVIGLIATGMVLTGLLIVVLLRAAPGQTAFEPESGTLSGGASVAALGGASGAQAVKFNHPIILRSLYNAPFSWDSIWNLPISTSAVYEPVNLAVDGTQNSRQGLFLDLEDISVDPNLPVMNIRAGSQTFSAHVDTSLAGNPGVAGQWNNCATFLSSNNTGIYQGQPLN
jgi:hypothetical protein